jgi:hypothetical protein
LQRAAQLLTVLGGVMLAVGTCFYATLKISDSLAKYYSTHTLQYTWVVSVAYLHGVVPFTFICLVLAVASLVTLKVFRQMARQPSEIVEDPSTVRPDDAAVTYSSPSLAINVYTALIICTHCVVIMIVNVLYVFAVLASLPAGKLFLVQFSVSLFKVVWSSFCIPQSLKSLSLATHQSALLPVFLSLFTFLASPMLAHFSLMTPVFVMLLRDFRQ